MSYRASLLLILNHVNSLEIWKIWIWFTTLSACYLLLIFKSILNNNWMGFCDVRNNQGWGEYNELRPEAELRLITLASTLIISDITKAEFNFCFVIHCFMENIQKLSREMQIDFICAFKNTGQMHQADVSLETIQMLELFNQRCITHAHCERYNLLT